MALIISWDIIKMNQISIIILIPNIENDSYKKRWSFGCRVDVETY